VADVTGAQVHRRIGDAAQGLAVAAEQHRLHQGGQAAESVRIGLRRLPTHECLSLAQPLELIEAPHRASLAEGGGAARPAEQPMHGRVHPGDRTGAVVEALIAAHPAP
jgi:hypothetical protein